MRWLDRWQREVVLPDATWFDKILRDHPELIGTEEAVERTLVDPGEVRYDRKHADREVFYRRGVLPRPYHEDYLKVDVEFSAATTTGRLGWVVTAHPMEQPKREERRRWRR